METRRIDDREFRDMRRLLPGGGLDEHVAREKAVPGVLGDDPDGQPVFGVGADKAVLHEDIIGLEVHDHPFVQQVKKLLADGGIDLAPVISF